MNPAERLPVLWSLSKRSGVLFQGPLFTALAATEAPLVVCPPGNPIIAAAGDAVLATPATIETPRDAARFARRVVADRYRLRRALARRASLVHVTWSCPWDLLYLGAAKRAGTPILLTLHDGQRHPGEENRWLEAIEDRIIGIADAIVCLSPNVQQIVMGRTEKPVLLIEDALILKSGPPSPPRPFPANRKPRILFFGRIHPYKGLDLLLDSLLLLEAEGRGFELVIAGQGDLGPHRAKLARLSSVEVHNEWLADDRVDRIFSESDIMALPYREASQSGVALDAQWAAMPAVSTRVGALPRQLRDGRDSLFADDSPASFADALRRLLTDPALYERLSAGAHESYSALGLAKVAERWRRLYSDFKDLL